MLYQTENPHGGVADKGKDILDFSSNVNPFGPPDFIRSAVQDSLDRIGMYPDPGCREALRSVSEYEGVPQASVLLGNGAAELIYSFCAAVRPRTAFILAPAFSEYETAVRNNGGRVVHHLLKKENGFLPDESLLPEIEKTAPDVLFLCNPNNPTGRLTDEALLAGILKLCRKKGILLFADECFIDLTGAKDALKDRLADHPGLLILKAFTKSYALAGLRFGYLLNSDPALLSAISKKMQPWNISVPAQAAAAAVCKGNSYLEKTRKLIAEERTWLQKELADPGFYVCPSDANFLLFSAFPGLDKALEKEKIVIRNCSNFHGLCEGWYRIAVRQHEENERLIRMIREKLREVC